MSNKNYKSDQSFYNFESSYTDTNNRGQAKKINRVEKDYNNFSLLIKL